LPLIRAVYSIWTSFNDHDGWALASHIALSALLALFPFLIFLTALASFFGTDELATTVVTLLFESWPDRVAAPLSAEIRAVLTGQRRDLLTIGAVLAIWFASSGVEAVRVGLNRAYGVADQRSFLFTRLQSIVFVLIAAVALIAYAFLVVLWPTVYRTMQTYLPDWALYSGSFDTLRLMATSALMMLAVISAHLFLPAAKPRFLAILPGVAATLALWLLIGASFGVYMARFASYASTYAGFAGAMIALVFLYSLSAIFVLGGELNAALASRPKRHS
jgi:membrane protein